MKNPVSMSDAEIAMRIASIKVDINGMYGRFDSLTYNTRHLILYQELRQLTHERRRRLKLRPTQT